MKAKIYTPARNAMQSGTANVGKWVIAFPAEQAPVIDNLMGWSGMTDTPTQVKLQFATKEEAVDYATRNGISYELLLPKQRVVKPKSYAMNFAFRQEIRS